MIVTLDNGDVSISSITDLVIVNDSSVFLDLASLVGYEHLAVVANGDLQDFVGVRVNTTILIGFLALDNDDNNVNDKIHVKVYLFSCIVITVHSNSPPLTFSSIIGTNNTDNFEVDVVGYLLPLSVSAAKHVGIITQRWLASFV